MDDVLKDLVAEYDDLETLLSSLGQDQWSAPSGAPGWTVRDVVVHLAQTEVRHVGWLGHATLPYAMRLAGLDPIEIQCTLGAPSGAVWTYGPSTASHWITGSAGAFCRVGARRLTSEDSGLEVSGPAAAAALGVLRNYAA